MLDQSLIEKMPKVELHCHLDGSISLDVLKKLAENIELELDLSDEEILERIQAPEDTNSLNEYLERFDYILPFLQTKENLTLAAFDVARQAHLDNVKYQEIRFAPMLHTREGLRIEEVVEAVCLGFEQAELNFDIKVRGLICGLRHETSDKLETLLELFASRNELISTYIVGFDLAGDEENFPPKTFQVLLDKIKSNGINLTLHAGECGCSQNIMDSIDLGAIRIGHGVAIHNNPEKFAELRDKKIVFEMAPTSNFQTKAIENFSDYPFEELYKAGVLVTLNTDNRTVSNTNLNKEYEKIADWYSFGLENFLQINVNALEGAFISDLEKRKLLEVLIEEYGFIDY